MMGFQVRFGRRNTVWMVFALTMLATFVWSELPGSIALAQCPDDDLFTAEFRLEDCNFLTIGENPHFILRPGYQLVLEGEEDDEEIRAVITVLRDTEVIDLRAVGLGLIRTRVVEEREWVDGELTEISRNFFAICDLANTVYYFGEDVDIFEDGELVSHEGAWRAGEDGAMPGVIMPGTFLLGSRYFQEVAPDVAVDRAEHTAMGLDVLTGAGAFQNCVEVVDTNPLDEVCDVEDGDVKIYCPGVGLTMDEELELIDYGFNIFPLGDGGNFTVGVRVFIDYRCNTFFKTGVDRPLSDVPVTLTFPGGAETMRNTGPTGHAYFLGLDVLEDGVVVSAELPPAYRGHPLGPCFNSPTSRELYPEDFGPFKFKLLHFGAELLR